MLLKNILFQDIRRIVCYYETLLYALRSVYCVFSKIMFSVIFGMKILLVRCLIPLANSMRDHPLREYYTYKSKKQA